MKDLISKDVLEDGEIALTSKNLYQYLGDEALPYLIHPNGEWRDRNSGMVLAFEVMSRRDPSKLKIRHIDQHWIRTLPSMTVLQFWEEFVVSTTCQPAFETAQRILGGALPAPEDLPEDQVVEQAEATATPGDMILMEVSRDEAMVILRMREEKLRA